MPWPFSQRRSLANALLPASSTTWPATAGAPTTVAATATATPSRRGRSQGDLLTIVEHIGTGPLLRHGTGRRCDGCRCGPGAYPLGLEPAFSEVLDGKSERCGPRRPQHRRVRRRRGSVPPMSEHPAQAQAEVHTLGAQLADFIGWNSAAALPRIDLDHDADPIGDAGFFQPAPGSDRIEADGEPHSLRQRPQPGCFASRDVERVGDEEILTTCGGEHLGLCQRRHREAARRRGPTGAGRRRATCGSWREGGSRRLCSGCE